MAKGILPPETSLDEVRVKIKETYSNPNVRKIQQVVLKEGPQSFKIATITEVINPETKEFHHFSLKIDHVDKRKSGWFAKPEKSVRLEGKDPDEIERLYIFLHALYEDKLHDKRGDIHIVTSDDYKNLEKILSQLPSLANTDKLNLIGAVLARIEGDDVNSRIFIESLNTASSGTIRSISLASRMIQYSRANSELKRLIDNSSTTEQEMQSHLGENPWMFGSEYSALMQRRTWTRDDRLDYMLRRTVDNYLEIIEIKTPFLDPLFIYDKSHDSYYPSSKLSQVIGQVMRYIEEVERDRDSVLAKDREDPLKIRARIIIGRDGNGQHQSALRNLNAHLHRIEILTFDQLLRISERVISVFGEDTVYNNASSMEDESDIPF